MPIEIPNPAEIAEANRIKGESYRLRMEAEDDQLAEEWIERAKSWLIRDYVGHPISIHFYLVAGRHVYYPDRFGHLVIQRFQGTGWRCEYLKCKTPEKHDGYGEIRFSGPDAPAVPQPIEDEPKPMSSRRSFWSFLGVTHEPAERFQPARQEDCPRK